MDVFVMESLPSSPVELEDGINFEPGKEDTISVQVWGIMPCSTFSSPDQGSNHAVHQHFHLNNFSSLFTEFCSSFTEMMIGWFSTQVVRTVLVC